MPTQPWYKQKSSWVGAAMIAASVGVYLDGHSTKEQLLTGAVAGLMCIFLQGASSPNNPPIIPGREEPQAEKPDIEPAPKP